MNTARITSLMQTSIPYKPVEISGQDLHANGKLLPDETIEAIRQAAREGLFSENSKGNTVRVLKKQLKEAGIDSNYNVILERNTQDDPNIYIEYYGVKRGKHLGRGSFGKVKYVQNAQSGAYEAIKLAKTPTEQQKRLLDIEYNLTTRAGQMIARTRSEKLQTFIIKLIPGRDIKSVMKYDLLPVEYAQMALEFTQALIRVHNRKLLHGDVKPENVIYDPLARRAEMTDFGLSMVMTEKGVMYSGVRGSPVYMSPDLRSLFFKRVCDKTPRTPEEIKALNDINYHYTFAVDVYSLGISLGQILKLDTEFPFTDQDTLHFAIKPFDQTDPHPIFPDPEMRQRVTTFLEKLTANDPLQRPNLQAVSEFLVELRDILREQSGNQKEVAIVDLAELEKLDNLELQEYVQDLLPYNEIQLVADQTDISPSAIARNKARLEEYGLPVRNTLIHADMPLVELMTEMTKQQVNEPIISQFYWIHPGVLDSRIASELLSDIKLIEVPIQTVTNQGIAETVIPYLPVQVDISDVGPDGLLIPAKTQLEIIKKLKSGAFKIDEDQTVKFSKAQLKEQGIHSPYSIIARKIDDDYELFAIYRGEKQGRALGKGASGGVKLVQDLSSGKYLARKAQAKGLIVESQNLEIMEQFKFKFEYSPQTEAGKKKYRQERKNASPKAFSAVFELAPGLPTTHYINESIPSHQMMQMFATLALNLQEVHHRGLLHLDLKPENMLYDKTNNIGQIIDFSTSCKAGADGTQNTMISGTENYLAPEMRDLRAKGKLGAKFSARQDIYSFGISLAELAGLAKDNSNYLELAKKSDSQFIDNTKIDDVNLRKELHTLLQTMTSKNPEARPSIEEVSDSLLRLANKAHCHIKQTVGVLDLKNYAHASKYDKEIMINALKNYDQIAVVYSDTQCDMTKIQLLKREIEQQGIAIKQSLLYGCTSYDLLASKIPLSQPFQEMPFKLKYFSVTAEGDKPIANSSVKLGKNTMFQTKHKSAVDQHQEQEQTPPSNKRRHFHYFATLTKESLCVPIKLMKMCKETLEIKKHTRKKR